MISENIIRTYYSMKESEYIRIISRYTGINSCELFLYFKKYSTSIEGGVVVVHIRIDVLNSFEKRTYCDTKPVEEVLKVVRKAKIQSIW